MEENSNASQITSTFNILERTFGISVLGLGLPFCLCFIISCILQYFHSLYPPALITPFSFPSLAFCSPPPPTFFSSSSWQPCHLLGFTTLLLLYTVTFLFLLHSFLCSIWLSILMANFMLLHCNKYILCRRVFALLFCL